MSKLINVDKNLYIFKCVLATDEVDLDNEKFTKDALREMRELCRGKIGFIEAYGTTYNPRIFDTKIKKKKGTTKLIAKAYIYLNTDEDVNRLSDFLSTHKECSISCSCLRKVCSVCSRNVNREQCNHIKGSIYGGDRTCIYKLSDVTDVYEWAFVKKSKEG